MDLALFGIFLLACAGSGAAGIYFKPGRWYESLEKPSWTPPDWLFPVAWTTIYLLISFAGARVAGTEGAGFAMAFWAAQAALAALWTPLFFGLRRMKAALACIVPLWACVAAAAWFHLQIDIWAGLAFLPYLAWVTLATALNARIWRLNPHVEPVVPSEIGT